MKRNSKIQKLIDKAKYLIFARKYRRERFELLSSHLHNVKSIDDLIDYYSFKKKILQENDYQSDFYRELFEREIFLEKKIVFAQ